MYSTCIGLILKGYNDYESKNKQLSTGFIRVQMTRETEPVVEETVSTETDEAKPVNIKPRKTLQGFMNSMKRNLIDLFQDEEDTKF